MRKLRRVTRLPLHQRFARGYQAGLVVAVIVSAFVWYSTQSGLDSIETETEQARGVADLVEDLRISADVLASISNSPRSLSSRSDLKRVVDDLSSEWDARLGDIEALPDGVVAELSGSQGLSATLEHWIDDASAMADAGSGGVAALSEVDVSKASRLENDATELADRMNFVVNVFESRADQTITDMRWSSSASAVFALAFLFLLVGMLLRPLKRLMQRESAALEAANQTHRAESERQELTSHLADGLEAAESEDETHRVVERAFERLIPSAPVELMLASAAKADLASAVQHPRHGGPGCGVDSPWSCPAVRRGRTMTYENSESINACPHLAGRPGGACSATCVPLSFMGESMGVIHTTGAVDVVADSAIVDVLGLVASQVAVRIGTLRSFAQVELQASTDVLTGLPNRRATEDQLERALRKQDTVSVAMADLDGFKQLNDKYGQETGDRVLRIFADSIRDALRADDWIGRWGGEEFVIVLPGMAAGSAKEALDRVRDRLADAWARAEAPAVTVSMGLVDTDAGRRGDELVRLADEALLVAKTQGRDRVVIGPVVAPLPGVDHGDDADREFEEMWTAAEVDS